MLFAGEVQRASGTEPNVAAIGGKKKIRKEKKKWRNKLTLISSKMEEDAQE